jgi:hypothetical protein
MDKWQTVRMISAALLLALVVLNGAFPVIRIGPFSFFDIHVFLLIGVILAAYLLVQRRSIEVSLPLIFLTLFCLYAVMSLLWSAAPSASIRAGFQVFSSLIVVMGMTYVIRRDDEFPFLVAAFLLVVSVAILISFWEIWSGSHLPASRLGNPEFDNTQAVSSVYFNQNYFVFLLSTIVPLATWLLVARSSLHNRAVAVGLLSSSFGLILYNGGRAGFIASCLSSIAIIVLWYTRRHLRQILPAWPPVLLICIGLGSTVILSLPQILTNPFSKSASFSIWSRWQLLEIAGDMLAQQPMGYGIGAFQTIAAQSPIDTGRIINPHSWLAQLAGEVGFFGLLLFVLAYGTLADQLFTSYIEGDDGYSLPLCIALLSFAVGSLGTGDPLHYSRIFWVLYGVGVSYLHIVGTRTEQVSLPTS